MAQQSVQSLPIVLVTEDEAEEYYREFLGTLSWWLQKYEIKKLTKGLSKDDRFEDKPLSKTEVKVLSKALNPALFSALGSTAFVLPFERYKKKCRDALPATLKPQDAKNQATEMASKAFSADTWSTEQMFRTRFKHSEVLEWNPQRGQSNNYWAASCIRNSFAHGQTTTNSSAAGRVGFRNYVEIWNSPTGTNAGKNFHVDMREEDFLELVFDGFNSFVRAVVGGGKLELWTRMVQKLQWWLDVRRTSEDLPFDPEISDTD